MLEEIHLSKCSRSELVMLAGRMIEVFKKVKDERALEDIIFLMEQDLEDINRAENRVTKSKYSQMMKEKDNRRDRAFKNFRNYCCNFVNELENPELEKAGLLLDGIFEKHGKDLWSLGYGDESYFLGRLFEDIDRDTEGAFQAVKLLGAEKKYSLLKKEQKEFEELYQEKVDGEKKKDLPLLVVSTDKLKEHISRAFGSVETIFECRPDSIKSAAGAINEIIIDIRSVVRARSTREKSLNE